MGSESGEVDNKNKRDLLLLSITLLSALLMGAFLVGGDGNEDIKEMLLKTDRGNY